jgi:hypothetical protein
MDAPVCPPVSHFAFSTPPESSVTSAASIMLRGGALSTMRQWGYVAWRPASGCLTMGTCEAAAGPTGWK